MINPEDILDMTSLSRDEIAAVAEHEHLGQVDAARLSEWLMTHRGGGHRVEQMISDDIRAALHADNLPHARDLDATLKAFLAEHPDAVRGG